MNKSQSNQKVMRGTILLICILSVIAILVVIFLPYPFNLSSIALGGPISTLLYSMRQQTLRRNDNT